MNRGKLLYVYRNQKVGFHLFLVVSEVPELYWKLREVCRKSFRYVSSKCELLVPSYDQNQRHCCFVRETEWQRYRETERQRDRQADRQTDSHPSCSPASAPTLEHKIINIFQDVSTKQYAQSPIISFWPFKRLYGTLKINQRGVHELQIKGLCKAIYSQKQELHEQGELLIAPGGCAHGTL